MSLSGIFCFIFHWKSLHFDLHPIRPNTNDFEVWLACGKCNRTIFRER